MNEMPEQEMPDLAEDHGIDLSPLTSELRQELRNLFDTLANRRRTEYQKSVALGMMSRLDDLIQQLADTELAYAELRQLLEERDVEIARLRTERNYARELASAQGHRFETMLHAMNAAISMLDAAGATVREARSRISGYIYEPSPNRPG